MSYSPTLGRWTETDPEQYIDGMNLYQADDSNPVTLIDPTGFVPVYAQSFGPRGIPADKNSNIIFGSKPNPDNFDPSLSPADRSDFQSLYVQNDLWSLTQLEDSKNINWVLIPNPPGTDSTCRTYVVSNNLTSSSHQLVVGDIQGPNTAALADEFNRLAAQHEGKIYQALNEIWSAPVTICDCDAASDNIVLSKIAEGRADEAAQEITEIEMQDRFLLLNLIVQMMSDAGQPIPNTLWNRMESSTS